LLNRNVQPPEQKNEIPAIIAAESLKNYNLFRNNPKLKSGPPKFWE